MKILWKDVILDETIASAATVYSTPMNTEKSTGETAFLIVSSAGTLAITQECSMDGGRTYTAPVDGSGNALGVLVAAMTVGTKYVVPSLVVAPLTRIKFVESTAETIVKVTAIMQEEQ